MRKSKYPIHPDFKKWSHINPVLSMLTLPLTQKLMRLLYIRERSSPEVSVSKITLPVKSGVTIRALLYSPAQTEENAPCLVFFHGGGFVFPAAPNHYRLAREYASRVPCKVLLPDYRLAPKYPFPTAPEDCFAVYNWVLDHAGELSVDPSRVAVGGDSAGGQLAAVVCLMALERGQPVPCAHMLIYPVTGRVAMTESMRKYTDTPMCNSKDIEKYTKLYVSNPAAGKPEYYSPIHAESPERFPPVYVETAEFDCLRDEGILYAERLKKAGVETELYNTQGTMHGFDIVENSAIVIAAVNRRVSFLQKTFRRKQALNNNL